MSFTEQVAKQLHKGACIQKAFNSISNKNTDKGQESVETETTKETSPTKSTSASHHFATIFCGNSVVTKYHQQLPNDSAIMELHPLVIHWFEKEVNDTDSDLHGVSKITVYCKYIREQRLVSLKLEFKFLKCILSLLKYFTRNPSKFFDYYYVTSVLAENFFSSLEKFSSM